MKENSDYLNGVGARHAVPLQKHKRKSIRLKNYDYSKPGWFFLTICTNQQQCLFGHVLEGKMILNDMGIIAEQCWKEIHHHFPNVQLDQFVFMPNHMHGILGVEIVGARHALPLQSKGQWNAFQKPIAGSLSIIIGSYKSAVTKQINQLKLNCSSLIWQKNYYEHVIRNDEELGEIRKYIVNNPIQWELDEYYRSK